MTPSQLTDLLVARLVRDRGGSGQRWRKLMGRVQLYDLKTHRHCNWAISPTGSNAEIAAIERLLDDIRTSHPIVLDDH
jgi:hypothetical protein